MLAESPQAAPGQHSGCRSAALCVCTTAPISIVMNTRAELVQAFEDYQAGRLGSIPAAHLDVDASTPDAG